jgi:hypothetical protein
MTMPAIEFGNHIALPGDPVEDSHATRRKYVQDQVAAKPSLGTGTPAAVAATASAGNATTAAPFNHVHTYTFYATAPANLATTATVGTATLPARGDHVHAFPTAAQVGAASSADLTTHTDSTILHLPAVTASDSSKVLTAGAAGAAPTWQTQVTGVSLGTAAGTAVAATAANGTGTTAAKVDHVHSYGFDTTAPAAVAATAAVGTATVPARRDHVHSYTFHATAPAALGTATVGTATLPARGDHVHAMPSLAQLVSSTYRGTVTGNGTATSLSVPHDLNSQELDVLVWTNTTPPKRVYADYTPTGANTLTLDFATAPSSTSTYIVRVVKWG